MMEDQVKAAQKIDKDNMTKAAENTCAAWAKDSALPVSKTPKVSQAGKWIAVGLIVTATVAATILTAGAGAGLVLIGSTVIESGLAAGGVALVGAGAAVAVAAIHQFSGGNQGETSEWQEGYQQVGEDYLPSLSSVGCGG